MARVAAPRCNVLLEICYFGYAYNGLASQRAVDCATLSLTRDGSLPFSCGKRGSHRRAAAARPAVLAVEDVLLAALQRVRFVDDAAQTELVRCGRTDALVSARRNYVNCLLRMRRDGSPYDYCGVLNRVLPRDIAVRRAHLVPFWFSCRFDCAYRTYKYVLRRAVVAQRELVDAACARFVGTHDFRCFCKPDPAKPEQVTERTVSACFVDWAAEPPMFVITGNAFLWHQVRLLVGCLYALSSGALTPFDVERLLAGDAASNPQVVMAPPENLILWDCHYPALSRVASEVAPVESCAAFAELRKSHEAVASMLALLAG